LQLSSARSQNDPEMQLLGDIANSGCIQVRHLRQEICNARDIDTAQKRSADALLAALLCRKTFMVEAANAHETLQADALACFLECAFTLKDNLPKNDAAYISKMPIPIRKLFLSDIKLIHSLESKLRSSIQTLPRAVTQAVNSVWAKAEGASSRDFTTWSFLPGGLDSWVVANSIAVNGLREQRVEFDLFEGTLFIDGQSLGRLPDEYTKQEFFQQMFGNRVFLTYPSSIPGMSYMLASQFEHHEIHFGLRDGIPILRARNANKTLEYIPPGIFQDNVGADTADLPFPLINGYIHWLDLYGPSLEIRPEATRWRSKPSNWTIDLRSRSAYRRQSLLIDPRSPIFNRVAMMIEPFERRKSMIIFQPQKWNISVDLPELELHFAVNREGLLESRQLRAVIDNDQDAGTLYGMGSSLVLRDSAVPADRSIIVAMGPANVEQFAGHTRIHINHTGYYARFFINEVLGRLECPPEPRLIYFKAYCHAVTAFVLPDPLTGRTGTDEAIHCLQAGNAQPWAPVDIEAYRILASIDELTPKRKYYPETLKVLQKVVWKEDLLPAVQHDNFQPTVCMTLNRFASRLHQS